MKAAPSIPAENFSALTRLDHERLHGLVQRKFGGEKVRNGFILGNHSSTQVPSVDAAEVLVGGQWTNVRDVLQDDKWLDEVSPHANSFFFLRGQF